MPSQYNVPARVDRIAESGLVWVEKLTNNTGTIEVLQYTPFRVRAIANLTVTVDGVLAASMVANEVMVFNAGKGDSSDGKKTVTIVVAVGACYLQIGRLAETEPREGIL
jgi:hypothetical protein